MIRYNETVASRVIYNGGMVKMIYKNIEIYGIVETAKIGECL